ncbi:MAG: nicotinamide riboside transporter PnuC [Capnocytophaga sp.]|nr:nicotinamide riboside transporter PnuC [Capnocytophaga sp.]
MSLIFDWIFSQYAAMPTHLLVLEIIGVVFGFLSVWYAKEEKIWVFPTGIISTVIFVYILWIYGLLGDMLINAYYTTMSVYGWWMWSRKSSDNESLPITTASRKEWLWSALVFAVTVLFIAGVYSVYGKWNEPTAYVDTLTTAIFFVGMWFMAKKKLENWLFWIAGDIISVPLYAYKGLMFTSLQYLLFTVIAYYGYREWRRRLHNTSLKAL